MIVIVEGCSGSGKSTLARELELLLGWPIFRSFRRPEDAALKGLIETHTYREDIYATDTLARLDADVICDRSLPSGIYHGREGLKADDSVRLLRWWAERLKGKALLILVTSHGAIASPRSRHGASEAMVTAEQAGIMESMIAASAAGLDCIRVGNIGTVRNLLRDAVSAIRAFRSHGER